MREEAGETYEVSVPLPMEEVYAQLSVWLGRAVTAEERSNAVKDLFHGHGQRGQRYLQRSL